jgi:hypothetical protein
MEEGVAKKPRAISRALEGSEAGAAGEEAITRRKRAPAAGAAGSKTKGAQQGSPSPPSIDAILASIIADTPPPAQP